MAFPSAFSAVFIKSNGRNEENTEENKKHVENFIAAACIAGFDGYYDAGWVLKRNYISTGRTLRTFSYMDFSKL